MDLIAANTVSSTRLSAVFFALPYGDSNICNLNHMPTQLAHRLVLTQALKAIRITGG